MHGDGAGERFRGSGDVTVVVAQVARYMMTLGIGIPLPDGCGLVFSRILSAAGHES